MNKQQVFHQITTPLKWYQGYCSQSYATQLKQKFASGNLGEKAIERLFNYFNYEVKTPEEWGKKQ